MAETQIRGDVQIMAGTIKNAQLAAAAVIDVTKLEVLADKAIIIGDGADNNKVVVSGDITIGNDGVAAIGAGVIVDADVNTDASIAESKLAFDTGAGHDHDGTNSKNIVAGGFDVNRETPTGNIDGTNTDFTLATSPQAGSEHLFKNGVLLDEGTDNDYSISGAVFSLATIPSSPDKVLASYNA